MDLGIKAGDFLAAIAGTMYALWPLFVLAPISWDRTSFARMARAMLFFWFLAAIAGFASCLIKFPRLVVISEPTNSLLFVGAGVVLLLINLVFRGRR
jgi:hypothetical protein